MKQIHRQCRQGLALLLALALCVALCGCRREEPDPHAGMVEVFNGAASDWITPKPEVPVSALTQADFSLDGEVVRYGGTACRAAQGVDVSYYQGEIDWAAVAASGVEFAMIRAGYRGYTDGGITEDERFRENAQGALNAGLRVGLYFFSQAVTVEEAEIEARWLLDAAKDFKITLPLVFDWEPIGGVSGEIRTDGMTGAETTACARAFCEIIAGAGYEPCIYFSRWQGYYDYDLSQLTDYTFWVSGTGAWDDFYYAHTFWQYTFTGTVDGIATAVDRNIWYIPITSG